MAPAAREITTSNRTPAAIDAPAPMVQIPAIIRDTLHEGYGLSDDQVPDAVQAALMVMTPGLILACYRMRAGK